MNEEYKPGFTKGSAERIQAAIDKAAPKIPGQIIGGINAIINAALINGVITQMDIFCGPTKDQGKKVRLMCIPEGIGEVSGEADKRMLTVSAPLDIGKIIEVKRD